MALAGITPNVSTELTNLIGRSIFDLQRAQPDPIEQVQPNQLEQLEAETDSINISSKARELSQSTLPNTTSKKK